LGIRLKLLFANDVYQVKKLDGGLSGVSGGDVSDPSTLRQGRGDRPALDGMGVDSSDHGGGKISNALPGKPSI
jgi:hypothetical protein